ncbi:uncharacterized protein [Palaemon carinicauda]|uniref:uncharacterized protein n=1 Tax=Palaemon carinicauda TaxID=392227 RepID=UPI0035B59C8A
MVGQVVKLWFYLGLQEIDNYEAPNEFLKRPVVLVFESQLIFYVLAVISSPLLQDIIWSPLLNFVISFIALGLERGTTFTSQLWTSLANLLGISLHQTTAYNLAANGMIESFHHTLKAALISGCKDSNWLTQLPLVLLRLKTTPNDALDVSAAEIVYGDTSVVPAEFFPSATSFDDLQCISHGVGQFTPCRQTYKPQAKHHILTYLHSAMHIFLHNETSKLLVTPTLHGPFPCDPTQSESIPTKHS